MEFGFENRLEAKYDALEPRFEGLMETAFRVLGIQVNYEVDLSLVDDEEIHRINREFRHVDRVTDVISFAFEDDDSALGKIDEQDPEIPHLLGEIFLCVPQALRQAQEIGNTPEREISFLFVHGILHLLGYDHMTKEEEEIMFPLQEKILAAYKEAHHE